MGGVSWSKQKHVVTRVMTVDHSYVERPEVAGVDDTTPAWEGF
jgi:hypothetical protein